MQHVPEEFVGPNSARDRRARVRHSPASLTYVKVGGSNGGVILDVSESGMAIASAEPLTELPLPPLSFRLPHLDHTFVTSAELVWNSDTKQSAGLRFGSLSDQDRLQIKNWIKAELYAEAFPVTGATTQPDRKQPGVSIVPRPRMSSRASIRAAENSVADATTAPIPRIPAGFPAGLHVPPPPELSAEKAAEFERLFPSENPVEMQAAKAARAEREKARASAPKIESQEFRMQFPSEHADTAVRDAVTAPVIEDPPPAQAESEPQISAATISEQATAPVSVETTENGVSGTAGDEVVAASTRAEETETEVVAPPQARDDAWFDAKPVNEVTRAPVVFEAARTTLFQTDLANTQAAADPVAEPEPPTNEQIVEAGSNAIPISTAFPAASPTTVAPENTLESAPTLDAIAMLPFIDAAEFAVLPVGTANLSASSEPAIGSHDEPDGSDGPVHDLHPVAELAALPQAIESKPEAIEEPAPLVVQATAKAEHDALDFPNLDDLPEALREPGRFSGGAVSDASVESLLAIAAAEESSEKSFRALRIAAPRTATTPKTATLSRPSPASARVATSAAPRHVSLRSPSQQVIPPQELESGDKNFRGLVVAASFVLIALCFAVGYSSGVRWLGFPWFADAHISANDSASSTAASNAPGATDSAGQPSAPRASSAPAYASNPDPADIPIAPKGAAADFDGAAKSNTGTPAPRDASRLPDSASVAPDPSFSAPPLPTASATPASFFPVTAPAEGSAPRMVELPDQVVFDSPKVLIRMRQYFFVLPEPGPEWKHKLEHLTIGDPAAKISPPPAKDNSAEVVRVRATIGKDGTVTNVRALSGSTTLIPQSLEAIRQWRYQPTLIDGKPMEWQGDFTIEFRPAP